MTGLSALTLPATTVMIIAGAAIVAALVTGAFSLVNLVISKEDKVSDSRQKWLEGLRERNG